MIEVKLKWVTNLMFFWVQIFIETKMNWRKKEVDQLSRAESGQNSWFLCDGMGERPSQGHSCNHLFSRTMSSLPTTDSNSKLHFNPEPCPTMFICVRRGVLECHEKNVIYGPINLGISWTSVQPKSELEKTASLKPWFSERGLYNSVNQYLPNNQCVMLHSWTCLKDSLKSMTHQWILI